MTAQFRNFVQVAGLCGTALLAMACGGGAGAAAEGAKAPVAAGPPANTEGGVAATPGGQQFAVSDGPTSGETGGPPRPALSGNALSAYQAGLQAFQAGDLQGAKAQFVSATQADSKAYQAYYSLGVVRER